MAREQTKIINHASDPSVTGGRERAVHTCRDGEAPPAPSRGTVPAKAGVLQKGTETCRCLSEVTSVTSALCVARRR